MIEICTVSGYDEVGKNMTAVKVDDEVVIFDMGLDVENYVNYTEDEEDLHNINTKELIKAGAVPEDSIIKEWRHMVKAIIPTHAHLDHMGAIPFLSNKYDADIICTPYTAEVMAIICKDDKRSLRNSVKRLNPNARCRISSNLEVEFINMTHSTPQTVMVALHTKYGVVIYANDFKFDNSPVLGKKPNFERLKELGKKGVIALIVDSLYSNRMGKTPSEAVAREMLKDVMLGIESKGKAVVVTTFSSHLARLSSIVEFGRKMNRRVVFLGRSLSKYVEAGENINLVDFSKKVEIVKYGKQVRRRLTKLRKEGLGKYLLVVTGHQAEPRAVLSRMIEHKLDFEFRPEDNVIFSCAVIPSKTNIENRKHLEKLLMEKGVRIYTDIHQSGHASREDLRDLLNMVKPKHVIPAHGELKMRAGLSELAKEMGYKKERVHLVSNGSRLRLS